MQDAPSDGLGSSEGALVGVPTRWCGTLRITCPLHPFVGKEVPIWLGPVRTQGREMVMVDLPNGLRQTVPVEWTDRRPTSPCPVVKGRWVLFSAKRLLAAVEWVRARCENLTAEAAAGGWGNAGANDTDRPRSRRSEPGAVDAARRDAVVDRGGAARRGSAMGRGARQATGLTSKERGRR